MPTVFRTGGLRVVIYPNDHRPAHVHIVGRGEEAVFDLKNYGFSRTKIRRIAEILAEQIGDLCRTWGEIHGLA